VLTGDDINAKIAENPELKGKVYVTIKDGEASGQVSWPLDQIPLFGKGRYLNGSVVFKASIKDGDLDIRLKSGECNGKKLPDDAIKQLENQNLAENMNDPEARKFFRKFESMEIKGDKVILKAKAKAKPDEDEPKKPEEKAKDETPAKDEPKTKADQPAKDEPKTKEPPAEKPADAPKEKTEAPKEKEDLPKAA
jgi:hypothetical protein